MLTLAAGPTGIRQPGTVVEVDDAEGKALVAGGYADVLESPKKGGKSKPATKTGDGQNASGDQNSGDGQNSGGDQNSGDASNTGTDA